MTARKLFSIAVLLAAATTPMLAGEIAVGGRVLVPGGSPLPDAEVRLLPLLDPLSEAAAAWDGDEAEPVTRAVTDEAGRFRLVAPTAGLYRVVIGAPGFVDLEADLVPLIDSRELPDAELVADDGLTVKVTDDKGAPVANANVRVTTDRSRLSFSSSVWELAVRRGSTGPDGTARLPRGSTERARVEVLATGRPLAERSGVAGTAAAVRLEAGSPVELQIVGTDDRPVADALVVVGAQPAGRTDEAGRMKLRVGRGKPRAVEVLARDGRRVETSIDRQKVTDEPYRVRLPERRAVIGSLIDARTRRPVPEAIVWDRAHPEGAVVADRSGSFVLHGPIGARLEITAGASGYMNAESREHRISDDGRPGPALVLEPAAAIEGTVVDGNGTPIAGAEVELSVKQTPGTFRIEIGGDTAPTRALTDGKGRFRLGPVDPENVFDVTARAARFAPTVVVVRDLEPYETKKNVRIEMGRGQSVLGRVVDSDGDGVGGASLRLEPTRPSSGHGMIRMMSGGGGDPIEGESDADGRFEIGGIPAGQYDLSARRSGFAKKSVPAVELKDGGEPVDVGEIALLPGERVQGQVTDAEGLPIEGVEVSVREAGGPMMVMMGPGPGDAPDKQPDAVTDPGGFFQIEDLAKGQGYELGFRRRGFVDGKASVELPRPELVEVELDAASDVTGLVLDPEGEPIVGAQVHLSRSVSMEMGGNAMMMMMRMEDATDADGRFLFEDQRPGTISLGAQASGWQETTLQDIEIPKGEDLEVDLPLKPGAVAEGRVLAPDGRPALGAVVSRVGEGEPMMARLNGAPVDGNGFYRLEGLVPGPVSIEATHDDYPRVVRDIEATEGVNALDFDFEGGQEVSGVVLDPAGNPVPGAAVRLVSSGRFYGGPETLSAGDGTFSMPGVQDGDYTLAADAEGFARSRDETRVSVAGQPVAGLEVRLESGATIFGKVLGVAPELYSKVSVSADGNPMFGGPGSVVDAEGNYRIENVSPGDVTVVASIAASGKQARETVTVEPGATEVAVDLQFGEGVTLSGRAVQGERPIADAMIYTQGIDVDHSGWNETDGSGRFRIEGLEPGRYRVQLQQWETGLSYKEELDLSTSREVELSVPTAQVKGTIVDSSDRQPLSGVTVTLDSAEPDLDAWRPGRTATTDMEGRFTLDAVGDGSWKLAASKKGYAAATRTVTVQHDRGADDLRLTLDPTEGLVLEARLASGAIPDDVQVAVLDASGGTLTSGTFATGENGRVRLSTVPPGSWELLLSGIGSATTNLSVQAPGPVIPVQLQPACELTVDVPELRDSGAVATVTVHDANGRPFRSLGFLGAPRSEWRMTGGRAEFRSLPPGSWTVRVVASDGTGWEGTTTTQPGAPATLTLE